MSGQRQITDKLRSYVQWQTSRTCIASHWYFLREICTTMTSSFILSTLRRVQFNLLSGDGKLLIGGGGLFLPHFPSSNSTVNCTLNECCNSRTISNGAFNFQHHCCEQEGPWQYCIFIYVMLMWAPRQRGRSRIQNVVEIWTERWLLVPQCR